jgi:FkbH-like protein
MDRIELQNFLFQKQPSRLELLDYIPSAIYHTYTVYIYRNHSFELIEHTIKPYLDYAQMTVKFEYSDYDDSLSFVNLNTAVDAILLWLDFSRYQIENVEEFIKQRIYYLRSIYKKHILIVPFNAENFNCNEIGVYVFDIKSVKSLLGQKYLDERLASFSGTKLSSFALLETSKLLALKYLPTLLMRPIKAIIVDLDNTLYSGVLGEDGVNGIVLTEKYIELQKILCHLSEQGIFLCIASKNDFNDVKLLFDMRVDFPLTWNVFTKVCATWDLKSESIKKIIQFLNIHAESVIFIDDNIGEIIDVSSEFPDIKIIYALNPQMTGTVLQNFPGLFRFTNQIEDSLRKDDVKANEKRESLKKTMTTAEYIKNLQMVLTYKLNNVHDITRIVELSNKTNQFIFAYRRYTLAEISEYMKQENTVVISIFLKDNLSDSGLIGACIVIKNNAIADVD